MRQTAAGMRRWVQRVCQPHPLFVAAVVVVACVAATDRQPLAGLFVGLVLGTAGAWCAGWRSGLAWALCGWLAGAGFVWRDRSRLAADRELAVAPGGWVRARLLSDGQGSARRWAAQAKLLAGGPVGATVVWEGRGVPPVAGSVVEARGNFGSIPGPRNLGEFDRASWLRRQGVAAVFQANGGETVATGRWAALGAKIRHGFRDRMTAGLSEDSQEAMVIRAVVIGEVPPDADVLIAAFRNSGTLHVFSVSGLHVAMVGSIGWMLLSVVGVPRRWAVVALLPMMFGYSWITGNSAPALRSAWMATVFLGAFVFRRKPDMLNALGAVLLATVLWDGQLLFQAGVQLSYGVVAAIAVGTEWTSRALAWMARPELYLPGQMMNRWQSAWLWLRRTIAQSLGVSLVASAGSAPLTAFHFALVTPVSVLANLVLVPLVFVLLVAGLAGVALSPIAPLARAVNRMNGWVANASVVSAKAFAAIPGGHFHLGGETRPILVVYDLPHGAGAACFAGGTTSGAVLLDCGDRQSFKRCVMPSLRMLGIEPDSAVISHPDGGHLGGGSPVWEAFPIYQALLPVAVARSPAFHNWLVDAPMAGVAIRHASTGQWLAFPDGAALEVLHAPQARDGVADDRVAVFRLHWRGWKILLTSDAGMGTEQQMLDSGRELASDVIITGHHRGDLSLGDAFLDAVHPQVIIASNARFPIAERLAPCTVAYWRSRGIQVVDQGNAGGVTLRADDAGNLRIEGFLGTAPLVLKPR